MNDFPILTVLIALPLVGALAVAFLPAALSKLTALGVSCATLVVGIVIAASYNNGDGMQLEEQHSWIEAFGVHYALGVDKYGADGVFTGSALGIGAIGGQLRRVQNGFVRSYALSILGGVLIVVLALLAVNWS